MGYDVTFHAVDEQALSRDLIPWVLGDKPAPQIFIQKYDDWQKVEAAVQKSLSEDKPSSAARTVTQLAVMHAACLHPYIYERGRAFSLAVDEEEDALFGLPESISANPEPLFAPLLARWPQLRGQFPEVFEGNYMTGVYIPARHVPALAAWLEKSLQRFDEGDRAEFEEIHRLIQYAAQHGLAVWEATDIGLPAAIPLPKIRHPNAAPDLYEQPLDWGGAHLRVMTYDAERAQIYGYVRDDEGEDKKLLAVCIDLSAHPARVTTKPVPKMLLVGDPRDGVFPLYGLENEQRYFARTRDPMGSERERLDPPPTSPSAKAKGGLFGKLFGSNDEPSEKPVDINRTEIEYHGMMGGRAIFIFRCGPYPIVENAARALEWRSELPKGEIAPGYNPRLAYEPGTARLKNGTEILLWNGRAYAWRGGALEDYCAAPVGKNFQDFSFAPWGEDGFYFLNERHVFRARPGQEPEACLPKIDNAMVLAEGPDGGVLITEGDNKDNDAMKWWLPDEDKIYSLNYKCFDLSGRPHVDRAIWQKEAGRIALFFEEEIRSISVAAARAQPCRKVSAWRKIKT